MGNNKKYNIVFAISYVIDEESEEDAKDKAFNMLQDDLGTESPSVLRLFGVHVEETEEVC